MKKLLLITESERNEILKLHNLKEDYKKPVDTKPVDTKPADTKPVETKPSSIESKAESKFSSFINKIIDDAKNRIMNKSFKDSNTTSSTSSSTDQSFSSTSSGGDVDSKWMNVTKKVIDKFEGGYWNGTTPKNVKTSKMGICPNHPKGSMGASTETMFGLDRYNGSIEKSADGQEFFNIIDSQKKQLGMDAFCKKWTWGYKGGENEEKLKNLAAKIMKQSYDRNAKAFFTPELQKRVESNDRLLMHFSYACWNGPGFFKQFANSLKNSVTSGKSDSELLSQAISDRNNTKLLRQDKVAAVLTDPNLNLA